MVKKLTQKKVKRVRSKTSKTSKKSKTSKIMRGGVDGVEGNGYLNIGTNSNSNKPSLKDLIKKDIEICNLVIKIEFHKDPTENTKKYLTQIKTDIEKIKESLESLFKKLENNGNNENNYNSIVSSLNGKLNGQLKKLFAMLYDVLFSCNTGTIEHSILKKKLLIDNIKLIFELIEQGC